MKSRSCLLCRKNTSDKKFDHTNLEREPKSNKSWTNLREFRRIRFGRKQRTLSSGLEHVYPFFIRRDKDSKEIESLHDKRNFRFRFYDRPCPLNDWLVIVWHSRKMALYIHIQSEEHTREPFTTLRQSYTGILLKRGFFTTRLLHQRAPE